MGNLNDCEIISMRRLEGAGNLKAFVDIRVGGALVITQCAVFDGKRGLFACLPRQMARDGKWRDVVFAADDSLRLHYQTEILRVYAEETAELTV